MALRGLRRAGIGGHGHEVPQVAGIAHRRVDALVGEHARDDQGPRAEIAQHVVEVGRDEHRRGGLGKHHFIAGGREFVDHVRVRGALRHVESRDLVIERPVAAVRGEALDDGVEHLDARAAAGLLQPNQVRQGAVLEGAEEIAVARLLVGRADAGVFGAVPGAVVLLHVDDEKRRPGGVDGYFPAQWLHHALPRNCRSAASSTRRRRCAQSSCPRSSTMRSWRISISTCSSPRASPWRGTL